jgi:predicted anti-sigma-YlaC factor YlaD
MECDRAREAVSARIDGEDCGVLGAALVAHLPGCAGCRASGAAVSAALDDAGGYEVTAAG